MSSKPIPGMVEYKVNSQTGTPAEAAIEAAKQNGIQVNRLQTLAGGKKYKKRQLKKIGGNGIPIPQPNINYPTNGISPNDIIAGSLKSSTQAAANSEFDKLALQPTTPTRGGYKQKRTRKKMLLRRKNKTNKKRKSKNRSKNYRKKL